MEEEEAEEEVKEVEEVDGNEARRTREVAAVDEAERARVDTFLVVNSVRDCMAVATGLALLLLLRAVVVIVVGGGKGLLQTNFMRRPAAVVDGGLGLHGLAAVGGEIDATGD